MVFLRFVFFFIFLICFFLKSSCIVSTGSWPFNCEISMYNIKYIGNTAVTYAHSQIYSQIPRPCTKKIEAYPYNLFRNVNFYELTNFVERERVFTCRGLLEHSSLIINQENRCSEIYFCLLIKHLVSKILSCIKFHRPCIIICNSHKSCDCFEK